MLNQAAQACRTMAQRLNEAAQGMCGGVFGRYLGFEGQTLAAAGTLGSLDSSLTPRWVEDGKGPSSDRMFMGRKGNSEGGDSGKCLACKKAVNKCSCIGMDPTIGTIEGCMGCGRRVSDCQARPCSWRRYPDEPPRDSDEARWRPGGFK